MMKLIPILVVLVAFTFAEDVQEPAYAATSAYDYMEKIGIPAAERIRKAEEDLVNNSGRIVGGVPAGVGQYPFKAGLISDIVGITGRGVCGGALISPTRVLTAAHCWFDGNNRAWRFTIVFASVRLFSGGTRVESNVVAMHRNWNPRLARNDIAVIYLQNPIATSANIAPIALPSGAQVNEQFAGASAVAAGFGITVNDGTLTEGQYLNHARLQVMSNSLCTIAYPLVIQPSHICTNGVGGSGLCHGDGGSPLVTTINNTPVLIGIGSFFSAAGCDAGLPGGYTRVTYFLQFINQHL